MAPSLNDWKIVDWDVKPQHNQRLEIEIISIWSNFDKVHQSGVHI